MDISSVNSDLIRGNSTTIILGALWNRDRYGYEILQEIDDKTNGQYKVKQATLYNQLKKLEKAGLISSYDGAPDDTSGARRRYYALTAEGRVFLGKEKSEYEYSRTILDKLISANEFDFANPAPFDTETLRPYTKTGEEENKPKIVYKEKIIEKEVPVEVIKEVETPIEVIKEVPVEVVREIEKKVYVDLNGNVITEDEAKRLAVEAEERERHRTEQQNETMKPASSIAELFARFDSQSEYTQDSGYVVKPTPVSGAQTEPDNHTYFNAFASENESRTRSQSTLKEIFEQLEREEKQIDEQRSANNAESLANRREIFARQEELQRQIVQEKSRDDSQYLESEIVASDKQPNTSFVTAATLCKRDAKFEFEDKDVNYRDFFSSIVSLPEEKTEKPKEVEQPRTSSQDLKTRLYTQGFKIRPYDRGNTSEYYTFNFLQSNRINRDNWLAVMAIYVLEIAVMWVSLLTRIPYAYFLSFLLVGVGLMAIPTVVYLFNPTRRTRANFNFRLSIINRGMIFIELTVVCILIGFFAVGASIDDLDVLLMTIILPAILLTNLPISSIIYNILYNSRKYHTA